MHSLSIPETAYDITSETLCKSNIAEGVPLSRSTYPMITGYNFKPLFNASQARKGG
jgi:hypothetical protein